MDSNDARKLSRSAQDTIRRKTVKAVVDGEMTQTKAAKVFGVSRTSVCLWFKRYRKGGAGALSSRPKWRPRGRSMTNTQEESIRKSVVGKCPDQLQLPGLLWTCGGPSERVVPTATAVLALTVRFASLQVQPGLKL